MTTLPSTGPAPGRLEIAQRAVVKVARQIAAEVSGTGGRSGGLLGVGARADLDARPEVEVRLSGTTATLAVTVGIAYPAPLREITEALRQRLMERVPELTGITVGRVDVTVAWLLPGGGSVDQHPVASSTVASGTRALA